MRLEAEREEQATSQRVERRLRGRHEHRQQARPEDDLRRGHRDEDEEVRGASAAELVSGQGQRDHRAQDRRNDGRDDRRSRRCATRPPRVQGAPSGFPHAASDGSPHTKLNRPGGSLNEKTIITAIGSSR